MAQQQQQPQSRFTTIMVVYLAAFLSLQAYMYFFGPKPQPANTEPLTVQAQKLVQEAKQPGNEISKADRIKKLEEAARKYDEFYNQNKNTPEGRLARFEEINVYDYLGTFEQSGNTHWYDQAEQKLKDMEGAFLHKTGTVTLLVNGQSVTRTGDLGQVASERLNEIRAARDQMNRRKPTWQVLNALVAMTGSVPAFSYAFALAFVVIVIKLVTFPFQKQQYKYMQGMQRISPLMKELQEEMKGRPPDEVNRRMMELYKEHDVSLTGGCIPMLVMMVSLFPVFWMVRDYEFQFTHGYFLWIGSELSKKTWLLADNLAQFDVPLFVLYMATMMLSMLIQPKPADPQQAQTQKMMLFSMPLIFGVTMFMYKWSSAFMLYWLVLNVVSTYQSWLLNKQFGTGSAGGGGTPVPVTPDAPQPKPLAPMSHTQPKGRGRSSRPERPLPSSVPGRVRPRRSGR